MARYFDFALDRPGLGGVRFLVCRPALPAAGDIEDAFLEGLIAPPRRHAASTTCAEALRIATLLLAPTMPAKMAEVWRNWGCSASCTRYPRSSFIAGIIRRRPGGFGEMNRSESPGTIRPRKPMRRRR